MENLYTELEYPKDLMGIDIEPLHLLILKSPDSSTLKKEIEKTISENLNPSIGGGDKIKYLETIWTAKTLKASFYNTALFNKNGDHTCPWENAPKTIAILNIDGVKVYLFDGQLCLEWKLAVPDNMYEKYVNNKNFISHNNLINLVKKICLIFNQKIT